jgi:hypothetical protein
MAQFFQQAPNSQPYGGNAQNLQFYSSSYGPNTVSGHETPQQASYGYSASAPSPAYPGAAAFNSGFAGPSGVSGRMGEQGGLRTGWLAAFGTEGYDGEPPLLEELGVNFGHIQSKVLSAVLNLRASKLTGCELDLSSAQSPGANRPTHNGRLRPGRSHSLLPPLWDLPLIVWKGSFRIYLWPRTPRQHLSPLDPRSHVPWPRLLRPLFRNNTSRPLTKRRLIAPVVYSHIPAQCLSSWLLPLAAGAYKPGGSGCSHGRHARLCADELCHCLVYVQQFRHVLRRGQDAGYEGPGGLPPRAILWLFWPHGDFL